MTYPKLCDGRWHRVTGEGTLFPFCREGWVVEGTLQVSWLGTQICSTVIKGRNTLRLEVDTQSNHTTGRLPETLTDSPALLHLGSPPSKCGLLCGDWDLPTLHKGRLTAANARTEDPAAIKPVSSGPSVFSESSAAWPEPPAYRGCLRKLLFNGVPVNMTASARIQGAVGMGGCPSGTLAISKQGKALTQRQANPSVFPLRWH